MGILSFASDRHRTIRVARRLAIACAFAGAMGAPLAADQPATATGQQDAAATVEISNFAFGPASVTISAGQSVAWVSRDSVPHTATAPGFDTGRLSSGQPVAITFDTAGEYAYNCAIHSSMSGTVVVQ